MQTICVKKEKEDSLALKIALMHQDDDLKITKKKKKG